MVDEYDKECAFGHDNSFMHPCGEACNLLLLLLNNTHWKFQNFKTKKEESTGIDSYAHADAHLLVHPSKKT